MGSASATRFNGGGGEQVAILSFRGTGVRADVRVAMRLALFEHRACARASPLGTFSGHCRRTPCSLHRRSVSGR